MAYTRHNWVCGEVINDTKMNNIEDGIEEALNGGALCIKFDSYAGEKMIFDKTWQEFIDAYNADKMIFVKDETSTTEYFVTYNPNPSNRMAVFMYVNSSNQVETRALYADSDSGYLYYGKLT